MERRDNYALQTQSAKNRFITYDQAALIRKLHLKSDPDFLYTSLFSVPYRVNRQTGDMQRLSAGVWEAADSFSEVMTLLDLLCDSKADRSLAGRFKSMQSFGLMFHQNMLESAKDPHALWVNEHPDAFSAGCLALAGKPFPGCDLGYEIEVFDGLPIAVQFWYGDDEFAPRLRYLWDENALQYIRYETMYYAVSLLESLIQGKR